MRRLSSIAAIAAALLLPTGIAFGHHVDGKIQAQGVWLRESLPGKDVTAGFLVLANDGDADALVGASCDLAASVELHTMALVDGKMSMRQVPSIALPSHGQAELAPGKDHLMLFGLKTPLQAGTKVKLRLLFEKSGPIEVEADVRAIDGHAPRTP